jgi:hypothetical protein
MNYYTLPRAHFLVFETSENTLLNVPEAKKAIFETFLVFISNQPVRSFEEEKNCD